MGCYYKKQMVYPLNRFRSRVINQEPNHTSYTLLLPNPSKKKKGKNLNTKQNPSDDTKKNEVEGGISVVYWKKKMLHRGNDEVKI